MRVTPSLSHSGRQPKGSIPLTPSLFTEYYFQPSRGLSHYGGCPGGGGLKHDVKKSLRERLIVSSEDFNKVDSKKKKYCAFFSVSAVTK